MLAAGLLAHRGVSPCVSLFAAFLAVALLAVLTRPRPPRRRRGASARLLAAGLVAGFASYPAWAAVVAASGLALGLRTGVLVAARTGTPLAWTVIVGLAPVLEELVYRERLLPALDRRVGTVPAMLLSSAAFAVPHLEAWNVLAAFLVGLVLAAVMQLGGEVALCIGLHMGLNLAALLRGVPPIESAAETLASAGVGVLALTAGIGLARRSRATRSGVGCGR